MPSGCINEALTDRVAQTCAIADAHGPSWHQSQHALIGD
jgi:hypothetical protein